jgi:hypothetical protein
MGKSLTFWSIIIGFLLGFLQQNFVSFINTVKSNGFLKAVLSINYEVLIISLLVVIILGWLFFYVERSQSEKTSTDIKTTNDLLIAIAQKLGVDTDAVLKRIKEGQNGKSNSIYKPAK